MNIMFGSVRGCCVCGAEAGEQEHTRVLYERVCGLQLPENHQLCYICLHLLRKFERFKMLCHETHSDLESSSERTSAFGKTDTLVLDVRSESESTFQDVRETDGIDSGHFVSEATHVRCDEDRLNDDIRTNITANYDMQSSEYNTETKTEFNKNDEIKTEFDENDEISHDLSDNGDFDYGNTEVDSAQYSETQTSDVAETSQLEPYFTKLELSLEEQKAELEALRKDPKYTGADFKCYSCALGFKFRDSYQSHMVRHEESNGEYHCSTCGLRFATQGARIMHRVLHSVRHRCSKCGRLAKPGRGRQQHEAACWQTADAVSCHLCGNLFQDKIKLQQHLRRMHSKRRSKKKYTCIVCCKVYNSASSLRVHTISKHDNRRFGCQLCPATFAEPYALARHATSHTQQDAAYCAECDSWYKSRRVYVAHLRTSSKHANESYDCPVCARPCATKQSLKTHIETRHTQVAAHECNMCAARYTSRKALLRHAQGHAGTSEVKVAVCHLCGKEYKGQSKLKRHLKEVCEPLVYDEADDTGIYDQSSL